MAIINDSAQKIVSAATYSRGYRNGFTNEQFLARQILKMQEELGELVACVNNFEDDRIAWSIFGLGEECRDSFDRTDKWQKTHAALATVAENNPDLLRQEIADMQVVLFNIARVIEEITREPFDVVQAAVDKAQADVTRGVR